MDKFNDEFDRIAAIIDPTEFEERRVEKAIGPLLANAGRLLEMAVKERDDLTLSEAEREGDTQTWMLVFCGGSKMVPLMTINIRADEAGLTIWATVPRISPFKLVGNSHMRVQADDLDGEWMKNALGQIAGMLGE